MNYVDFPDSQEPVPFLTEKEAATLLKISEQTLQRIRHAGEIRFYRIGGRIFYLRQNVMEFVRRCGQGGGDA